MDFFSRSIPVVQKDPGWRCRSWRANALAAMAKDGKAVGTSVLDWQRIEQMARRYVGEKTARGTICHHSVPIKAEAHLRFAGGQRDITLKVLLERVNSVGMRALNIRPCNQRGDSPPKGCISLPIKSAWLHSIDS